MINGLYKTELIHRLAPWKTKESLELATLEWVSWFNHHRLLEPIGYVPLVEAEENYYRQLERFHDLSSCLENSAMRKTYVSDISREKFEEIHLLMQSVRRRTKPRTMDLHEVFCAVLNLLRTDCQWRFLLSDFPKWRTVHSYFSRRSEPDQDGISAFWSGI